MKFDFSGGLKHVASWPFFILACFFLATHTVMAQDETKKEATEEVDAPKLGERMSDQQLVVFARLALKNIHKQYPNKPNDVLADESEIKSPKELHPAFYGCFDWHSSVHGHWMLVKLL